MRCLSLLVLIAGEKQYLHGLHHVCKDGQVQTQVGCRGARLLQAPLAQAAGVLPHDEVHVVLIDAVVQQLAHLYAIFKVRCLRLSVFLTAHRKHALFAA